MSVDRLRGRPSSLTSSSNPLVWLLVCVLSGCGITVDLDQYEASKAGADGGEPSGRSGEDPPDAAWPDVPGAEQLSNYFPDCDGDGVFSSAATVALDKKDANARFNCEDGRDPDGGWSQVGGTDCDDEDPAIAAKSAWYPDCDGDGVFGDTPKVACDANDANTGYKCGDGQSPDGGWSKVVGSDCDDEDATAAAFLDLYPDCDGDGAFGTSAVTACDADDANARFNCGDGKDPDGGWSGIAGTDCNDEDMSGGTAKSWYADCDGDGVFSGVPRSACGVTGANAAFNCLDGADPDGGWSSVAGTDCNDEDVSGATATNWYGDCDGDGVFSGIPRSACGVTGANTAFDCLDGADPDGGWSSVGGTDCNDEDVTGVTATNWYADCDGDGVFVSVATNACGKKGANKAFDCLDGQDPDGGWSSVAGADCNDANAAVSAESDWYPDCDGDGIFDATPTSACEQGDADVVFDCADGLDPDGGWSTVAGTDCKDEEGAIGGVSDWYPDCDGDGVFAAGATSACDQAAAAGVFTCADAQSPDGGWSSVAGTDCNDENAAAAVGREWYADCDGDGVFSSAGTSACDENAANLVFDCADGLNPEGGWSSVEGTDCNDENAAAASNRDWYADCDNDGVFSSIATSACDEEDADVVFDCPGGGDPGGGWSGAAGTDCNDADGAASITSDWYPDCDGDGVFDAAPRNACGVQGADGTFKCNDGQSPDGGWSAAGGSDCNDEDAATVVATEWYPDCDGDGVFAQDGTVACGAQGASAILDCVDGSDPDGSWSEVAGVDCNDEDASKPCACGEQDNDGDLICAPVDSLRTAQGVATVVVELELSSGSYSLHVDGDYDFGGWVLIGRGREDWAWAEAGKGEFATMSEGLGTSAAFSPSYLPTSVIGELIGNAGIDLTGAEIRIKRAAAVDGSAYQETLWRSLDNPDWTWLFDSNPYNIEYTVLASSLGAGVTMDGLTSDVGANDHRRTFTWALGGHKNKRGFSYGESVALGTKDPTNFLWQDGAEAHAMPYSEVYIRYGRAPASCREILTGNPSAQDGTYLIDPDGQGGNEPFEVICDMAAGGWTLVYSEDFSSGESSGWENGAGSATPVDTTSSCASVYSEMLGGFNLLGGGGVQTVQTFDLLGIAHSEVSVALDYVVIDSWDSEKALVYVDGVEKYGVVFAHSTAAKTCGELWGDHGPQAVSIQTAHTGTTATVRVTSTLNSGANDESFGVDNVFIWVR